MALPLKIDGGFAEVGAGLWLAGRGQPAAFSGRALRRRRRGWRLRDRARLDLVETEGAARFSDSTRPFLTHIPCAVPVFAVSGKVLVAPAGARKDAYSLKLVPMSVKGAICVTEFGTGEQGSTFAEATVDKTGNEERGTDGNWVVMATAGRTCRMQVAEGETLSVRPEAAVAWTGRMPTGFCQKLSLLDILLPRGPRDLLLTFYGPGIVWIEGSCAGGLSPAFGSRYANARRAYGF